MILQEWANYFGVHQANLRNSIIAKGFDRVYNFYYKKHNGVFPDGGEFVCKPTANYNLPITVIAIKETMPIVLEEKSIRAMSRQTNIHHFNIETSIKTGVSYKGWKFEKVAS